MLTPPILVSDEETDGSTRNELASCWCTSVGVCRNDATIGDALDVAADVEFLLCSIDNISGGAGSSFGAGSLGALSSPEYIVKVKNEFWTLWKSCIRER